MGGSGSDDAFAVGRAVGAGVDSSVGVAGGASESSMNQRRLVASPSKTAISRRHLRPPALRRMGPIYRAGSRTPRSGRRRAGSAARPKVWTPGQDRGAIRRIEAGFALDLALDGPAHGQGPPLGHTVESLALHQSLLIVALGEGGLAALDVGDVSTPHVVPFVGSIDGTADKVQVEANRLCVRDDTSRVIVIFDLQHWPEVARLGEFPSRPDATWDVLGNILIHAYFDHNGYFEVVDLAVPTEPRQVAHERLDGNPCGTTFVAEQRAMARRNGRRRDSGAKAYQSD